MKTFDNNSSLFNQHEQRIEQAVEDYESRWQDCQLSLLDEHATSDIEGLLGELVETEIELRFKQGLTVEDYLRRFPQLSVDKHHLARLVFTEFRLRTGPRLCPVFADYLAKFPDIQDELLALATTEAPSAGGHREPIAQERVLGHKTPEYDRYTIVEQLDAGGRGSVSLARDELVDRLVCVKQILPEFQNDATAKSKFLHEAHVTGKLEHPGIVPIHGIGTNRDGLPFYAMRFVRGVTLKQKIRASHQQPQPSGPERALAERELLNRFLAVCHAVHYAHQQGVIHRDLKPANVMVGDYGETFVVDWGLAKLVKSDVESVDRTAPSMEETTRITAERTHDGAIVRSPPYMSPEQAHGDVADIDVRTDVYGLGAILYEILTGLPPFHGRRATGVISEIRQGQITPPRAIHRSIARPLESICRKALAKNKADRYATARALARDIEQYLADQPIAAQQDSLIERAGRFFRHHRGMAAAIALSLIVLTAASILSALAVHQAKDVAQLSEARTQRVLNFVVDVFQSPDAAHKGHDVTVAEAITNGMAKTEEHFADDPQARAKVLSTFGTTLGSLGLHTESEWASRLAYDLLVTELGSDHPDTLRQKAEWANMLLIADRPRESIPLHEEVHQCFVTRYGANHEETLDVANSVGRGYSVAGEYQTAIDLLQATSLRCEQALGEAHELTFTVRNNLALAHRANGDLEEASRLLHENVQQRTQHLGPDHLATARANYNRAVSLIGEREFDEAIAILVEVLAVKEDLLPPEHESITMARFALAVANAKAGRTADAIPIMEQAIDSLESTHGGKHSHTINARSNYAHTLEAAGLYDQALEQFERVADFTGDVAQDPRWKHLHSDTAEAIVRILLRLERFEDARAHAAVFLDSETEADSSHSPKSVQRMHTYIGDALLQLNEHSAARQHLERALELADVVEKIDLAYTRSCAGEALTTIREFARAEGLLLMAQETLAEPDQPLELQYRTADNTCRLVQLYDAWGKSELAQRWSQSDTKPSDTGQ